MMRPLVIFSLCLFLIGICVAQVNFSPNWGKRALNNPSSEDKDNGCKESVDTLILIYKLIQSEAQKLLECEKLSN
ncbi:hypothetical protein ABEB36_011115 [Hypothenemus hampei]|uniref:Uncharacterized protein n=1 Tax=Hypothenemus hampei TaxID=57062 RepID=A0ABD1EEA5_HYPHA